MTQTSISEFPLTWRWTEEEHSKLPDEHLARIVPISPEAANNLWKRSLRLCESGTDIRPSTERFEIVTMLERPHSTDETERWIRSRFETYDLSLIKVWVSWQPDLAVQTDMEIVALYWNSFCYEASDDTSIFPESEEWAIHFWHEDRLYHATNSEQAPGTDR